MTRYALVSVSDKRDVVRFARGLVDAGFTILSTGGTRLALEAAEIPVTSVSSHTWAKEIMDGRVKTLHPRIHGGILGDRVRHAEEALEHGIPWIDVVVCNLYPFEAAVQARDDLAHAIENIDIGGPAMVRAAAKNHPHVIVVVDPGDYGRVADAIAAGTVDEQMRLELAVKAFRHTSRYDAVIADWMARRSLATGLFDEGAFPLQRVQDLRYGENPHQRASFYADGAPRGRSLARVRQRQGKELSYNNLADADAAIRTVFEFDEPACVIVKHANPCGVGTGPSVVAAYERALAGDPVSAYGGILAFNRPLLGQDVSAIKSSKVFYEVLAAPGFDQDAVAGLATRENLRVLDLPDDWARTRPEGFDAKRVQGGWLVQDWDLGTEPSWRVVTQRVPTPDEVRALQFAWACARNIKSNAIALALTHVDGCSLAGVGAGQMSRVDSVQLAIDKAGNRARGAVLASDAFFPFADGVHAAIRAGVTAIIQPGGSIRDQEVIAAVEEAGVAMVLTGVRHFRH